MRLITFLLTVAAGVSFGGVGSAHADEFGTRARLDYQAAEGCPDAGAFTDQVAARLGFIPFQDDASQTVRVRLMADGDSWMGTAEVGEASPRLMRGPRCEDVARDLAAAVAVILVPEPPEPEPEPEPQGGVVGGTAPPAPAVPSGPPGTVPVRFSIASDMELEAPGIHLQTGVASGVGSAGGHSVYVQSGHHERLCTMPCEASLPPETHQLAISTGSDAPLNLRDLTTIPGPAHVHIDHESYQGTRTVGTVMYIVGVLVAAGSPFLLIADVTDLTGMLVMGGAGVGLMVTGFLLGSTDDEVDVSVTPF